MNPLCISIAPTALGYWCFYCFMVVHKLFTLDFANKVLAGAPKSMWSDGIPPRPLHKHILKGAKGNRPKRGGKMRQTASDMVKFALARFHFHHTRITLESRCAFESFEMVPPRITRVDSRVDSRARIPLWQH